MAESKNSTEEPQNPPALGESNNSCDATDAERDLAQAAHAEFSKSNYAATFTLLSQLQATRPKDPKVLMNKAVVEYYRSDLKKTEVFRKQLVDICSQAGFKIDEVGSSDEVDRSVIHLNNCIILYHLHQYRSALELLEKMYTGLESLEESVGIGVCLLMAECYLGAYQPEKVLTVISHTETTFLPQPLPHTPSPKQPPPQEKENKSPEKTSVTAGSGSNGCSSSSSSSSSISSNSAPPPPPPPDEIRCSATQEQLRGKLQQLRVRAMLMMRALRVAKKELKTIVTHAVSSGKSLNVTLVSLKSQLEYLRGNYRKAIKVLNQCAAIPPPSFTYGPSLGVMYYNNLGVIHMGLGKPTVACLYLQKALQETHTLIETDLSDTPGDWFSDHTIYQLSSNVRIELYYNLGVTLLHMNKPEKAFDFLLEVLQVHSMNPRLWLRLAECCIAVHKLCLKEDVSNRKSVIQGMVGVGMHRKICISTCIDSHNKKIDPESASDAAVPVPTLEFGRLCLRNTLVLLPENASTTPLTDEQEASGVMPELFPAGPSSPLRGTEVVSLRVSALACNAYVCLCLADHSAALRHAETLLVAHPKIPGVYKLLGHLYAGEALICLGRVSEAVAHFDPRQIGDISLSSLLDAGPSPPLLLPNDTWSPGNMTTAMQVMRYNLSVAYALRGELEKADTILKEVCTERNGNMPAQVIMLAMYIQLQMGHPDVMKNIIKKNILLK